MTEQQWPEEAVEDAALQIHWKRHGHDDPNSLQPCAGPTDTDRAWARAVLAALASHVMPRGDEWEWAVRDADGNIEVEDDERMARRIAAGSNPLDVVHRRSAGPWEVAPGG